MITFDAHAPQHAFRSFWMGGFECADHLNAFGNRINMYQLTGHADRLAEDYRLASSLGIKTIREGLCWSIAERTPYTYDFSLAAQQLDAAAEAGIEIIWDICHFGYPDDLTPLHPMFARRLTSICVAFTNFLAQKNPDLPICLVPVNEVSFVSWLGGEVRGTVPYTIRNGWDVKYHLMKAYIEAIKAVKAEHPAVRIITSEPLISICTMYPADTQAVLQARHHHENQFQVLDMLTGVMCPELGGHPSLVDYIGLNFYFNNQWIHETHEFLPWGDVPPHPYWKPLSALLQEVFLRYGKPMLITETGHPGEHRANWLAMIHRELSYVAATGLPLAGCCLYPLIDRPDWDHPENWHHSGLYDIFDPQTKDRIPSPPVIDYLKNLTGH